MNPLYLIPISLIAIMFVGVGIMVWKMKTAPPVPPIFNKESKERLATQFKDLMTSYENLPPEEQKKLTDLATHTMETITPIATRTIETISPTANYILTGKKQEKDEPKQPDKKEPPDLWT